MTTQVLRTAILALLCTPAIEPQLIIFAKKKAAACSTAADSQTGASSGAVGLGYNAGTTWNGTAFTAGSTYTLCAVNLYLTKTGSPTFTVEVFIYTDNAGVPGTLVGTGSGTVNASTVGTSEGAVSFTGMSASITSGTTYWIVAKATGSDNGGSNYLTNAYSSGAPAVNRSSDGTSWTLADNGVAKFAAFR